MRLRVLRSRPLAPIAGRMKTLTRACSEVQVASAFLSKQVIEVLTAVAADARAHVRLLTGTFGNSTRKATFKWLLRNRSKIETRIWTCGSHQDFHAKLFIWRHRNGQAVAWIGSANLTIGGMQREGELLLEISGAWNSNQLVVLRKAFQDEWKRGVPLDLEFLKTYRESKRQPPDAVPVLARKGSIRLDPNRRVFATYVARWFDDESTTARRIDALLGGTAKRWHMLGKGALRGIRPGDLCVYVDVIDNDVALVRVTDVARDKGRLVFAHEPVFRRAASIKWNKKLKARIAEAGIRLRGRALGTRWLDQSTVEPLFRAIYGRRAKRLSVARKR